MVWQPATVAFGVRHKRLFGVLRSAGDAIDAVLALQGSGAVPRRSLTKIGWPDPVTARLVDDDESFTLTINVEGITLTVDVEDVEFTRENARDMFLDVVAAVLPITDPSKMISRVGIVETYSFPQRHPATVAAEALTVLHGLGQPTDFALRAVFRSPDEGAVLSHPSPEWWNTILQVASAKRQERADATDVLRVSIDHQHCFDPERFYSARVVREHFVKFMGEVERLQQEHIASLGNTQFALDLQNG